MIQTYPIWSIYYFFVEKGDFKSFASEVRKHDNFLKDLDLSIKNKKEKKEKQDIWSAFFIMLTVAFRSEMTEKDGKYFNKIYYKLILLLPEIAADEEEEKEIFATIASKLGDSEEYGRDLVVYRALRYSIQYNDEDQSRKILDSKTFRAKNRVISKLLISMMKKDPVDQE